LSFFSPYIDHSGSIRFYLLFAAKNRKDPFITMSKNDLMAGPNSHDSIFITKSHKFNPVLIKGQISFVDATVMGIRDLIKMKQIFPVVLEKKTLFIDSPNQADP